MKSQAATMTIVVV